MSNPFAIRIASSFKYLSRTFILTSISLNASYFSFVAFNFKNEAIARVNYARCRGLKKIRLIEVNLKTKNLLYDGVLKFDDKSALRKYSNDLNE